MSEKQKKLNSVSFGKLFLLFLIIFIFVTYYISFQISAKLTEENEKQIESFMVSQLDSYIADSSEEGYIWKIYKNIIEIARQKGLESQELSNAISECKSKYKITSTFLFYKNMELAKGFNYISQDINFLKKIIKNLLNKIDEKSTHDTFQRYFGAGSRITLMIVFKGLLKHYNLLETKQFYYWNDYEDGISVFFFTTQIPDYIERIKIILSEHQNDRIGAIDSSNKKILPPGSFSEDQALSAYIKTLKSSKPFVEINDYYWYFQTTNNSNKICFAIPKDSNINSFYNWAALFEYTSLFLLALILIISITSMFNIVPGKNTVDFLNNLSIKYRIIGILTVSSVFPAIMSLIFGFSLLSDKEKVLEETILSESLAGISNIENQYKVLLDKFYKVALEIKEAAKEKDFSVKTFHKYLEKYSMDTDSGLTFIELRDGDVNSLITMHDREISGIATIMDLICRIVLKLHCPKRINSTKLNISPAEIVSESVVSTDELGFSTLLRHRGKKWTLRSGAHPTLWYWDVYPELATGPAFICFSSLSVESFKRTIEDYFKDLHLASDSMQLYAYVSQEFFEPKIQPHKYNSVLEKQLLDIVQSTIKTNKVLFRTVNINGKAFWLTAKEEKNVRTHVFMHLIDKEERLKVLTPYKWQLVFSGIFTMFLSLFGAWYIISLVILPVNNLTKGIEAIRYRIRDYLIPVTRKDEFGKLATAFNKVIKEFDEMDYGRVVQESLLPVSSPQIEGYDIAYYNIAASDLAGDYHDHAILDDGKLTLLLGDVSGHGISASLAMAMAKATFNYAQALKVKFPEEFMEMLNTMFNKELKPRNKLMTMISMVLNPKTGEVIFDNSGQAYPAYFTASTQTSEEIKMPSLPLGGMKKRKKKAITKNMEPGDAFIFYSDGIIEASAANGEMFGYERFFSTFTEQMKLNIPAQQAIENIYQAVENFREPGHHSDDITLIIVRRKS